jgi:hypothetical protein
MALVAAAIQPTHIGNRRFGLLGLDLERGDQGVLGPHHDPFAPTFPTDADSKLRLHKRALSWLASSLAKMAPFGIKDS